jgi:hypothetical protein
MTLTMTDVAGLTVDAQAADVRRGTITVHSDGRMRTAFTGLSRGTKVSRHGALITQVGSDGTAAVPVGSGSTVIVLGGPASVGGSAPRYPCVPPPGHLLGTRLGPVTLGMKRATVRKHFTRRTTGGRRDMDVFCTASQRIRVGYPSARLLWYLTSEPGSRELIKVRGDLIEEIGIAVARLTRSRQAARRFFGSFG